VSFSDRDSGYRKRLASIEGAKAGFKITIGVHEDAGSDIVQVAEWNEFGTERSPARPTITAWADSKGQAALARVRDETAAAIKAGKSSVQRADQLAQVFAGEIQGMISAGVPPPNAPSTVRQKGSSIPLIASGQFRASIRGRVESR
jgi:hypothetical protein